MDQKLSPILPPPSVDDLLSLSAGARLGQVDFANRLVPAPDCGMKYLPRDVAFGKLKAMVDGAAIVRRELS